MLIGFICVFKTGCIKAETIPNASTTATEVKAIFLIISKILQIEITKQ